MQPITLRWSGPIETVVRDLAERAGLKFRVKGNLPTVPLAVNVDVYQQPILHVLRDIACRQGIVRMWPWMTLPVLLRCAMPPLTVHNKSMRRFKLTLAIAALVFTAVLRVALYAAPFNDENNNAATAHTNINAPVVAKPIPETDPNGPSPPAAGLDRP